MKKLKEIGEETKSLMNGRTGWVDAFLCSILFTLTLTIWNLQTAIIVVFGVFAWLLLIYHYSRGVRGIGLLGGLLGAAISIAFVYLFQSEEAYFAPALITDILVVVLGIGSVIVKRPFVAWNSALFRRWPWDWYWHDRVRPAYTETTWLWIIYFSVRLVAQLYFFRDGNVTGLAWVSFTLGWAGTTTLLITTYIYGIWRLRQLGGPSVEEFRNNTPPPWESQRRGF